jgi:ribosomal protein S27AE
MVAIAKADSKMICPRCVVEMNHHSDKIVYGAGPQGAAPTDPTLGGFIEEFHACPKCGGTASRPA